MSAYAPQVECTDEEKEEFWEELEELIRSFSDKEKIVIGADLNGHIGRGNTGYERWHGGFGHGENNQEGDNILEFTQAYDLALGNSLFKKREEHYVTYMSGTNRTVIDYILVRRQDLRDLKDCKVIPGESIASQHRLDLLVASVEFKAYHKKQQRARVKKIKCYMLKQQEKKDELALRLAEHMGRRTEKEETTWEDICHMINTNAKEILGETSCGKYVERESWWWNDDVQKAVKEKRDSFKKWQSSRTPEDLADYRENKTNAKKAVTTAKDAGYEELYTKLDSREGQDMIYKLAKTRYRRTLDQEDIVYITDERKHIITDPKRIIGRWLGHFKHLLNIENERDGNMTEVTQREDAQHTVIEPFELLEVAKQMKKMQNNKACGPDGVPTESLRLLK